MTCVRCKRITCCADQLGRTAMLLGFPNHLRLKVTTAQDECDYFQKRLKKEQQP
jgi:hypothetical protein